MNDRISDWKGYVRRDFTVGGIGGFTIEPKTAAPGRPWLWRPEFFEAFHYPDLALLDRGWHIAHYKFGALFGSPTAVDMMYAFQQTAVAGYDLAKKVSLFGFSRGGLYAMNYAAKHPDSVASVYLDAPVLDIRSWPAGWGAGVGTPSDWEVCKAVYGLTDETAKDFREGPLDKLDRLAAGRIPILLVAGDADELVPYPENGALLAEAYPKHGGVIQVILKPGVGHHPHSLEDPTEIVAFAERYFEPEKWI